MNKTKKFANLALTSQKNKVLTYIFSLNQKKKLCFVVITFKSKLLFVIVKTKRRISISQLCMLGTTNCIFFV